MKSLDDISLDDGGLDLWDVEITLSSGEIVELPEVVARMRASMLERRETERIAWCARHGKDPATFGQRPHECFGCGGTGWNHANHLPCWCAQGRSALALVKRREQEETDRLREVVTNETRKNP